MSTASASLKAFLRYPPLEAALNFQLSPNISGPQVLSDILEPFSECTGLKPNDEKCTITTHKTCVVQSPDLDLSICWAFSSLLSQVYLSPSEHLLQIFSDSLQALLRYHLHNNGSNGQPKKNNAMAVMGVEA